MQSSDKCRAECGARMANLTDLKAKNIKNQGIKTSLILIDLLMGEFGFFNCC
jgi:hypothetical protein